MTRSNQFKQIWYRDKGICQICGEPIESKSEGNIDHIIPKSRGGGNTQKNLQLTHISCNSDKGSKIILKNSVSTKVVESDEPSKLWNEIAVNGFKNLSFNAFKEYFNRHVFHERHNKYQVEIRETRL